MNTKFNYAEKVAMAKKALTGPIASVSVPFLRDGEIDYDGLRNCVEFIIEAGSGTVLLTHGDSLYSILTDEEIGHISKVVVDQTAGRAMTVVAGMGSSFHNACNQTGSLTLVISQPKTSTMPLPINPRPATISLLCSSSGIAPSASDRFETAISPSSDTKRGKVAYMRTVPASAI